MDDNEKYKKILDSELTTKTKYNYINALKRLTNDFNDIESIIKEVSTFKQTIQKTMYNALLKIKEEQRYKDERDRIIKEMDIIQEEKEQFNIDYDKLVKKYKKIKIANSIKLIYTLLLFYPNQRREDYYKLKWGDYNSEDGVITFKQLVKSKTTQELELKLSEEDKKIFDLWKSGDDKYIFHNGVTLNCFGRMMREENEKTFGIKAGMSIYRKLISIKYKDELDNINNLIEFGKMQNHTLATILKYYTKANK